MFSVLLTSTLQSDEYKALMARLRREEEQRAYERMTNPLSPLETFSQRLPNQSKMAQSFAEANRPGTKDDLGDDDVTYDDVHRQLMLILNFMVSIFGVAGTLWVLARWWSTPARLFLTIGGSILVGIAEVGLYSGYIWHLGEEKKKEKKKEKTFKEVKQVVQTWVVGQDDDGTGSEKLPVVESNISVGEGNLRRRRADETKE
jgi:TMEM199 family protein